MSAIGAAFGRGVASLGGPQLATAIVVGGIVVGGLGGAYIGSRPSGQTAVPSGELAVYPCPDQGPALITVKGGQKLLATGRTEDAAWIRIHYPLPGRTEAWVQSAPLTVDGPVLSLAVAACAPQPAVAAPAVLPAPPLTAIQNNTPSPAPTPEPTPTPSPSPTPNAAPSLTGLTASTRTVSYDQGAYCPNAVKKVTFTVKAGDTSGLAGVALFWREPGASAYAQAAMTRTAGTPQSGTWQVTLDTKADGITAAGKLAYYAVATDTDGATRRIPASGSGSVTVAVCANTGPTITSVKSSSGSLLYWIPPSGGACRPTTTNITAAVKDVDGVKSVTLFWRAPGAAGYSQSAMARTTGTAQSGTWQVTLGDKITHKAGSLSWYIKAVDTKGKASQTKAASITIRVCDTTAPNLKPYAPNPATIGTAVVAGVPGCGTTIVEIRVAASDGESGIKSVTATPVNERTGATLRSHTMKLQGGGVYLTTFNAANSGIPWGYYFIKFTATNGEGLSATAQSTRFIVTNCTP